MLRSEETLKVRQFRPERRWSQVSVFGEMPNVLLHELDLDWSITTPFIEIGSNLLTSTDSFRVSPEKTSVSHPDYRVEEVQEWLQRRRSLLEETETETAQPLRSFFLSK